MKKRAFLIGIIIAAALAFTSIGFATWGILGEQSGKAEGRFTGYTIIDLEHISESTPVFYYNNTGFYSANNGYSYETTFTIQINAPLKDEAYDLSVTLIDQDNFLSTATITSSSTRNNEIGTKTILVGNIISATTFDISYTITSDSTNYSTIFSNLSTKVISLRITAVTESGIWTIDKIINLEAEIQSLAAINKPVANNGLVYNGNNQTLVNSGTGYTLSGEVQKNAGNYNVTATLLDGYCWSDNDSHTSISVQASIAKKSITLVSSISINYSSNKTWSQFQESVVANAFLGALSGDTVSGSLVGMHNGYYKYGTVSGSYVSPSEQSEFGSNYTNVIGSTYLGYFTVNDTNYVLTGDDTSIIKYKTAKLGDSLYTIEDAFAGSGTISFVGNSSGTSSYVATAFTRLSTSLTGYSSNSTFTLSNRILVLPFKDGMSNDEINNGYVNDLNTTSGNVYSALIINDGITINTSGSSAICSSASMYATGGGKCVATLRGVIINMGSINVNSNSNLKSYGYIKGNGIINIKNGANYYDCLTSHDWPGGSAAREMCSGGILSGYTNKIFFTNSYTIHNNSCDTKIYGGALFYVYLMANVSSSAQKATALLIGNASTSNCLFRPNANSESNFILKSVSNKNNLISSSNQEVSSKDKFEIYGSYVDRQFKLTITIVVSLTIESSKDKPCPIGLMDIVLKNGCTLTLSQADYLFLPGSSLTIESGATLNVTDSAVDISFATYSDINSHNTNSDGTAASRVFTSNTYSTIHEDSYLLCNGTFNNSGNISGHIKTSVIGASMNFTGNMVSSYICMHSTKDPYYFSNTASTYFNLYNGSTISESIVSAGGTYTSTYQNSKYGFFASTAVISYDTNNTSGGSPNHYNSKTVTIPSGGYTISSSDIPGNPTKNYYNFVEWKLNNSSALGQTIFAGVTLIASYSPINYSIIYHDVNGGEGTTLYNNPNTFNYETNQALAEPIRGNLTFGGWYLTSTLDPSSKVLSLDGSVLVNSLNGNNVLNLYASWYEEGTETYTIYFENSSTDVVCPASDTIVAVEGYDWSSYNLPNMTGKDNTYTVQYYFDGWYDGTTKVTSISETMFDSNNELSLTAHYLVKNTLTVWAKGTDIADINVATIYYKPNSTSYTIPSIPVPDGYALACWIFSNGSSSYEKLTGENVTLSDELTLTADLRKYYTVSFTNGGGNKAGTATIYYKNYKASSYTSFSQTFGSSSIATGSINITEGGSIYFVSGNNFDSATFGGTNWSSGSGNEKTISGDTTASFTATSSGCITSNTLITLSNGSQKPISELNYNDKIMSWDFSIGAFVETDIILLINHGVSLNNVLHLVFEDYYSVDFIADHGLFDTTTMRFEYLCIDNVEKYVGHTFAIDSIHSVKLIDYEIKEREIGAYSIYASYTGDVIANGMITMTPPLEEGAEFFGFFEVQDNLMFDTEQIMNEIEEYGLYDYSYFESYITYEQFDKLNGKYLKIAVDKGIINWNQILYLIEFIKPFFE